jgi:glutathione S-transferase
LDIHAQLDPESQAYFRKTREARIGMTLEEFHAARGQDLTALTRSLEPFRAALANEPFLSGESPKWLDYTLMGTLIWPHVISNKVLITEDDPLHAWRDRMFGLFDGALRNVLRAVD